MNTITEEDSIAYCESLTDDVHILNFHQLLYLISKGNCLMERGVTPGCAAAEISEAARLHNVMAARLGVEL